ncbi:MAG: LPS export ABC transporter periplasmic protein LptC [Candidatus Omnitrophica bacterium]|nr:LPS export ABC transporter periplasmic protein LptC [Candidatus Omnitrophota bacterium]
MILKTFLTFLAFLLLTSGAFAEEEKLQESDQQIQDFSLSSFGEKGKKSWDLSGKSADIFSDVVKLKSVVGNLYGKDEDIKLTADNGDFDKAQSKIHLQENVVITTSSGAKLTTKSLDWDRKNQLVTSKDIVNIEKGNMVTTASGVYGEPGLKKVSLEKDVTVNINPTPAENGKEPSVKKKIVITCDGALQIDYQKNVATFNKNVKVDTQDALIESDIMDVYFGGTGKAAPEKKKEKDADSAGMGSIMGAGGASKIDKIVARINVKITRGENVSYSDEATYDAVNKKIILSGKPKLILYSGEGLDASLGN